MRKIHYASWADYEDDEWKLSIRICQNAKCGNNFCPNTKGQRFCSVSCATQQPRNRKSKSNDNEFGKAGRPSKV